MLGRKEIQEQTPEPIQPYHIEKDMEYIYMNKHIAEYTPRLICETLY